MRRRGQGARARAGPGSVQLPCNILAARAREGQRRRRGGRGASDRAAEAARGGSAALARSLRFAGSGREARRRQAACRWRG